MLRGARLAPSDSSYPKTRRSAQAESRAAATRLLNRPGGLFYYVDDAVDVHSSKMLCAAAWPADLDVVYALGFAQAEVNGNEA